MPNSSPRSRTRAAALSARSLALPPDRSIGIIPIAGKMNLVFQSSMYSALPTNVMRRGNTNGIMNESMTDVWFGHRIAGPSTGTFSRPSTLTRQPKRNSGVRIRLATVYSCPYSRCSFSDVSGTNPIVTGRLPTVQRPLTLLRPERQRRRSRPQP